MQASAALIREQYLRKPIGKSNVAIAVLYISENVAFCAGATSKGGSKSPIPIPKPKSAGGQFEPATDSYTQRLRGCFKSPLVGSKKFLIPLNPP